MPLVSFLFRNSRTLVIWAVVTSILSGFMTVGLLAFIHSSLEFDGVVSNSQVGAFIGLFLISLLSGISSQIILVRITQNAIYHLRLRLSRQILATPLRQLETLGSHRLLTTLSEDIPALSNGLNGAPIILVQLTVTIGCLVYIGWLSLTLLAMIMIFSTVAIIGYWIPSRIGLQRLTAAREQKDHIFKHYHALTRGAKELKLNIARRQAFLSDVFEPTAHSYRQHVTMGFSLFLAAANWGHMAFFLVIGMVIFVIPKYLPMPHDLLTGTALVMLFLRAPLDVLFSWLPDLGRSQVALQKIHQLGLNLADDPSLTIPVQHPQPPGRRHTLALRGVTYCFDEDESHSFHLGPINETFTQGELVFVVGGNGSGKSTLVKLITGLYEPTSGSIHLNENPVTTEHQEILRQEFAVVFSDFFLFESLLGIPTEGLDQRALEHLNRLQLAHKVKITDGTFSTLDLSRGQRKRLALLTAFLENRPFFVFDEWAADQDPFFKEIFYLQILPELKQRGSGIICITHDDKYFHIADRIIRLESGKEVHKGHL